MPISRYRCRKCNKEFQVFQKITDSPLTKCCFCEGKVDLIPTPLFYNTPSFSLAFANKDEEKSNENKKIERNKKVGKPKKSEVKKAIKKPAPKNKKETKAKPKKKMKK